MLQSDRSIRFFVASTLVGCGFLMATLAHADDSSSSMSSSSVAADSSSSFSDGIILNPTTGSGINILPGSGTISIDQKNGSGDDIIGQWVLIRPNNTQKQSAESETTLTDTSAGTYTIFLKLPTSASATIRVYRNGTLENLVQRPQATFTLYANDTIHIVVHYTITRTGLVAVDSDPLGMSFRMTGPNNTRFTGTTPASFPGVAEGQYQVTYDPLSGCNIPTSKSLKLSAGSRISFTVRISCAAADKLRERQQQLQSGSTDADVLSIGTGDKVSILRDVSSKSWFAPYVAIVAKYGILSGYKDASGNPTGEFGPGNNVTVAELAKAAHSIAGLPVDAFLHTDPQNAKAQNAWFSPYIASAENHGWTIYNDAMINPLRPATRAEVMVTLLQALDVPLTWQKGTFFTDVTMRTQYASAIETAAAAKVVEGRKDANGNDLHTFGPTDLVNRAEFAKILSAMIDTYKSVSSSSSSVRVR